jgi:hypothetical protein
MEKTMKLTLLPLAFLIALPACSRFVNSVPEEPDTGTAAVGTVTVQQIVLVDAKGVKRATLGASPNGSGLAIFDQNGKARAALIVAPDGHPGLALYDDAGVSRATVQVSENGDAGVALYDSAGKLHAAIVVSADGTPTTDFRDASGKRLRAAVSSGR